MTVSVTVGSEDRRDHPRVLVIEDEESYRQALVVGLQREGFVVDVAGDGYEGIQAFRTERPDIVLLDVLLPGMHGTEVCRRLRQIAPVPVVMVSAIDSELDVVLGLELGAAGYVTKPYRLRELVARINAILRRSTNVSATVVPFAPPGAEVPAAPHPIEFDHNDAPLPTTAATGEGMVEFGGITVDFERREVSLRGTSVHLSRREFDLLATLVSPIGVVRTREELIDLLWPDTVLSDSRTLDTHVHRLRNKLEDDPRRPRFIATVRGVGFRLEA